MVLLRSAIAAISAEHSTMIAAGRSREAIHDSAMRFLRAGFAALRTDRGGRA